MDKLVNNGLVLMSMLNTFDLPEMCPMASQAEGDYENWEGTLKNWGGGTLIEKF